jgi:hypothetical protein
MGDQDEELKAFDITQSWGELFEDLQLTFNVGCCHSLYRPSLGTLKRAMNDANGA